MEGVIDAISKMVVRGAPAIAIAGMYGIVLFFRNLSQKPSYKILFENIQKLKLSRPTAVNLSIALESYLEEIKNKYESYTLEEILKFSENYANTLYEQESKNNQKIAEYGSELFETFPKNLSILTHCNTGSLATAGIGTALGVIKNLKNLGYNVMVYVDETRPFHQGSRLTAWELQEEGIDYYIITDTASAWAIRTKNIRAVIVGADRIASNGDTANKIGTYFLSIIALNHKIPFYVAAPSSTFDFKIPNGDSIEIEMRAREEITQLSILKNDSGEPLVQEGLLTPPGAKVLNPAFDVTPAQYISAIITEKGVVQPVNEENVKKIISS